MTREKILVRAGGGNAGPENAQIPVTDVSIQANNAKARCMVDGTVPKARQYQAHFRARSKGRAFLAMERRTKMKLWLIAFLTALVLAVPVAQSQDVTPGPNAEQLTRMQDRMKQMQEQMDRINQTKDPKERQKLIQEHMQTMQEQMKDMRAMGGGMMMGMMGQHGRGMRGQGGQDPAAREQMMQDRMDMMQMMMEHMMDQMQLQAPTK
jgi:hypothetical protein